MVKYPSPPHNTSVRLIRILFLSALLAGCAGDTVLLTEPTADFPVQAERNSSARELHADAAAALSASSVAAPESVRLRVPFASQAPLGNWDMPYQEACEEASLLLIHHYLSGEPLDPQIMDQSIVGLVSWEDEHGFPHDVDVPQLAEIARDRYGYRTDIVEDSDVSIGRIEQELASGNPVIVPLAGQDIGNPYFSGDGPPYHMLVIVGFDKRNFVTHDVGTRRGEYYAYRKQVMMDAIHDWTGSKDMIRSGAKRMLIVRKQG